MVPRIRFRAQPSDTHGAAGEFLRQALYDPEIDDLTIVVAWARFRGLARLRTELAAFKERGSSRIIVGIDEGGATRPGLHAAMRWFSTAYVFHDQAGGTFHPKIYLAEGETKALLLVGSSNATPGGLFFNHEASLEAEFELPGDANAEALLGAHGYINRLLEDNEVCLPLDEELIERLIADPRYRVSGHERRSRPAPAPPPTGAEEADVDEGGEEPDDDEGAPIFGSSRHARPVVPALSDEARAELADLEIAEEPATAPPAPAPVQPPSAPTPPGQPPVPPAVPVMSWRKKLPATDAQHQSGNITGNVRLTKARRYNTDDIPQATWFREDFFGGASWTQATDSRGNPIEVAPVTFDVTIAGIGHGPITLEIDHGPHRISNQGNHATILHWGELEAALRQGNYTGRMLEISRLSDGSYRLEIL